MASSNYSLLVKVSNPLHVFVECQGHSFNKKVFRCQWIIATSGELMLFFHFKVQVRPPIKRALFSCWSQNFKFQLLYKPWLYCTHVIITCSVKPEIVVLGTVNGLLSVEWPMLWHITINSLHNEGIYKWVNLASIFFWYQLLPTTYGF